MGLTNASVLTNDGRAVLSFDPDNPSRDATVTVDGTTYTQGSDGLFAGSDGKIWSGETPGSGMTASAGSQLRSQMGNILNSKKVSNETIDKWGAKVNGANKEINTGGASAGDSGDGGTPQTIMEAFSSLAGARKQHRTYGDLRYPLELFDTDYMMIRQFKYVPLSKYDQVSSQRERRADRRHKRSIGSVTLPIPSQLVDANSVSWNNSNMNDLQMAGIRAGSSIMNSGAPIQAAQKIIDDGLTSLENNTGTAKQFIQNLILGQLPGINQSPNEILGRFQGQIINPNLELIFGGVTLRQFQYSFRLTPRNNRETLVVRSIIRFFKQGMSIKENPTNFFLSAPNVFQPRFYNKDGQQHTFINTIKKCACTSFTVNYVPDNTFMTLPNSSMTAYEISMGFQELDPIIDQDYAELDNNQDDVIGF